MRTVMRPRYYCDHCNKGNGSPSAMRRHESGCTLNPKRVCGMCKMMVDVGMITSPGPSRDDLIKIMDADGFEAMCEAANHCPACILSALRTKNSFDDETGPYVAGPQDGRESWSYVNAKKKFWDTWNEVNADSGDYY